MTAGWTNRMHNTERTETRTRLWFALCAEDLEYLCQLSSSWDKVRRTMLDVLETL